MFLDLGCAPAVVVSSADMAEEIIKTNDIIFSNQPETMAANFLYYGSTDVAFSQYGENWRQAIRKFVSSNFWASKECNLSNT